MPNIKDAGRLSLPELARALDALVATARDGKTSPADMQRGTITITNVGVFGVDSGTPILNPGESAILCFGAVRDTPWVHEGEIAIRKVTQLALSFDHRIVDGQLGSEFLADIAGMLGRPLAAGRLHRLAVHSWLERGAAEVSCQAAETAASSPIRTTPHDVSRRGDDRACDADRHVRRRSSCRSRRRVGDQVRPDVEVERS